MGCCGGKEQGSVGTIDQKPKGAKDLKLATNDKPWEQIEIGREVKVTLHEHTLKASDDLENDEWLCNGS